MRNQNNISNYQLLIVAVFFITFITIVFKFINIFMPFLLGFIFAYLLEPIVIYFTKVKKFHKILVISIVTSAFFVAFFIFLYYLIPTFLIQVSGLLGKLDIQYYFNKISGINNLIGTFKNNFPLFGNLLKNSIGSVSTFFLQLSSYIFTNIIYSSSILLNLIAILLITPILTFYFAFDMQKIQNYLKNLIPKNCKQDILRLLNDINNTIAKYLRGQLTVSIILGLYYSAFLFILSIDYSIVLGIFSGFALFIPYLGIAFSFVITSVIAFIQFKTFQILLYLMIIYIFGHILEGVFITPKIIGKTLNLHPLWIILGLVLGGSLLGFFGVLFAIPLTAITAIFVRFVVKLYKKSKLYKY